MSEITPPGSPTTDTERPAPIISVRGVKKAFGPKVIFFLGVAFLPMIDELFP